MKGEGKKWILCILKKAEQTHCFRGYRRNLSKAGKASSRFQEPGLAFYMGSVWPHLPSFNFPLETLLYWLPANISERWCLSIRSFLCKNINTVALKGLRYEWNKTKPIVLLALNNSASLVGTVAIQEHISRNEFEPSAWRLLFKGDQLNQGSGSFKLREKEDELGGLLWHEAAGCHTAYTDRHLGWSRVPYFFVTWLPASKIQNSAIIINSLKAVLWIKQISSV